MLEALAGSGSFSSVPNRLLSFNFRDYSIYIVRTKSKNFRLADIFEAINYAFLSVRLVSFVARHVLSSGKFCLALSFTTEQIILIQKKKKK